MRELPRNDRSELTKNQQNNQIWPSGLLALILAGRPTCLVGRLTWSAGRPIFVVKSDSLLLQRFFAGEYIPRRREYHHRGKSFGNLLHHYSSPSTAIKALLRPPLKPPEKTDRKTQEKNQTKIIPESQKPLLYAPKRCQITSAQTFETSPFIPALSFAQYPTENQKLSQSSINSFWKVQHCSFNRSSSILRGVIPDSGWFP